MQCVIQFFTFSLFFNDFRNDKNLLFWVIFLYLNYRELSNWGQVCLMQYICASFTSKSNHKFTSKINSKLHCNFLFFIFYFLFCFLRSCKEIKFVKYVRLKIFEHKIIKHYAEVFSHYWIIYLDSIDICWDIFIGNKSSSSSPNYQSMLLYYHLHKKLSF